MTRNLEAEERRFNPRTREGYDDTKTLLSFLKQILIPVPAKGTIAALEEWIAMDML